MSRLVLPHMHTTTWAYANMDVMAVVNPPGSLCDLGMDVHGLIHADAGERVPVAFLVTTDRAIKRFRALIGTTVAIEMTGYEDKKGNFSPNTLNVHRVRVLKNGLFSPRARTS
jgi:hypothetical protein